MADKPFTFLGEPKANTHENGQPRSEASQARGGLSAALKTIAKNDITDKKPSFEKQDGPAAVRSWMDDAALMFLAEMSMEQIALQLSKPLQIVAALPGLPEFKVKMQSLAKDNESGVAQKLINGSIVDAVLTVIRIHADTSQKADIRLKAAMHLLDRGLGKVVEASKVQPRTSVAAELASRVTAGESAADIIDKEIADLMESMPQLRHKMVQQQKKVISDVPVHS